ncbi:MAG TPA: transposase, partial [Urbifossiella sp.]|nr:transposase [Urbifossiella sp.]
IDLWRKTTWPRLLREAKTEQRTLVFVDEAGFYLLPSVVKTYAPVARTPVLRSKWTRDHPSVMGGMTPRGRVHALARQHALDGSHGVEFLAHLTRVAGERLPVARDGSPIHRRRLVRDYASDTHGKVRLEALPGYAPDLNPWDEGGRNHLKNVETRNLVCRDMQQPRREFHPAVARLRQKAWLIHSFHAQAGLELETT